MKNPFLFLGAIFCSFLIFSCGNSPQENKPLISRNLCDGPGSGNLLINFEVGQKLIDNFTHYYQGAGSAVRIQNLKTKYWVSKCIIDSIVSIIRRKGYDGARIIFGVPTPDESDLSLFIVPTKRGDTTGLSPDSIPYMRYNHINIWDTSGTRAITCANRSYYFLTKRYAKPWIDTFETSYRAVYNVPNSDLGLSKSVWLDSCVFSSMKTICEDNTDSVEGMNINIAAYPRKEQRWSQYFQKQTTIVIVAASKTIDRDGNRENVWDVINKYLHPAAYNHGELCPNACDLTDPYL